MVAARANQNEQNPKNMLLKKSFAPKKNAMK